MADIEWDSLMINRIIITIFVDLWNGFFIISLLHQWCNNKKKKIKNPVLYAGLAAFSGFPICYTAKSIIYLANPDKSPSMETLNYSIIWFSFAVSRISFYAFMVLRCYVTFRDSSLSLSKNVLLTHILIIVIAPLWIIGMVVFQSFEEFETYYKVATIFCIVIIMIGSVHLLYMFNKRLYWLLSTRKETNFQQHVQNSAHSQQQTATEIASISITSKTNSDSNEDTANTVDTSEELKHEFNKPSQKLLYIITKHTMLTVITVGMFLLFVALFGILSFGEWDEASKLVLWWVQCITINVATLCIYLSFSWNNRRYKMVCRNCHSVCSYICGYVVEKKL